MRLFSIAAAAIACLATACAHAPTATASSLSPEQVRIVQRALTDHGYPADLTGTWDHGTQTALVSFQGSHHLPRTGIIDTATADALGVDPNAVRPVANFGSTSAYAYPFDPADPAINCAINNSVDCRPVGG